MVEVSIERVVGVFSGVRLDGRCRIEVAGWQAITAAPPGGWQCRNIAVSEEIIPRMVLPNVLPNVLTIRQ
jgi:hypothetical protein